MAAVPALTADLEQILMDSGATTGMNEYLLAMRITTPNFLAVFSPDEPHYRTNLVDPFVNGIKIGTVDHQTDIHPASTAAILLQVRTECVVKSRCHGRSCRTTGGTSHGTGHIVGTIVLRT